LLLDGSPGRRNPARGVPGDYQRRVAIEEDNQPIHRAS